MPGSLSAPDPDDPNLSTVAPGVYSLRLPMPFRLDHINVYLLEGDDGWVIVDCGLDWEPAMQVWERVFDTLLAGAPVRAIVVTHMHPDHIGLAAWLQERSGARIWITQGEWDMAMELHGLVERDPERLTAHYTRFGLDEARRRRMLERGPVYGRLVKRLPREVAFMEHGSRFAVGHRDWEVRIGRGHSPEHACLWSGDDGLLISGDHVLPEITPNISYMVVGSRDPLGDYLDSLADFDGLPAKLALPSHGPVFADFAARIEYLVDHHRGLLDKLHAFCDAPRTVLDCTGHLFGPELAAEQLSFAVGEAAAHLVYLAERGRLAREGEATWRFDNGTAGAGDA